MYKYSQMNRFHYDRQLQVYMCAFMYIDLETMSEEDYFTATKICVANYKKIPTPVPVPKYWLGFSFICSEYYELDMIFDET